MPSLVLGIICIAVALLLAVVNLVTAQEIEDRKIESVSKSLRIVIPDGNFSDSEPIPHDAPDTVTGIYKDINGKGTVVTLSTDKGYTGNPILITVGVDNEGKIIKAVVTSTQETKTNDEMDAYPDKFTGSTGSSIDAIDTVAGVTYSSKAVKGAIRDALVVLGYAEPDTDVSDDKGVAGPVTRSDEEIYDLALELLPGADSLELVTFEGSDPTLNRAFKAKNGKGYVFYIATGSWGRLETEALVATNNFGKITDINFLTWGVGHGVGYTEEFVESFKGLHKDSLDRVELVASATGTSENFKMAVYKALEVAFPTPIYTVITVIIVALAVITSLVVCIVIHRKRRTK